MNHTLDGSGGDPDRLSGRDKNWRCVQRRVTIEPTGNDLARQGHDTGLARIRAIAIDMRIRHAGSLSPATW
jgi:hypothetical protein